MKFDIRIFENLIFEYSFFSKSLNEYIQYSYSVQIDSTNIFDIRIRPKLARQIYSYSVQNFIFVLHCFKKFLSFVCSPKCQLKLWGRSSQWLLRYSTFNILRSSSIGCRLHFKHLLFLFVPLSLSFKFEEDPMSGCWDIQLLIFWGRLPLEVVFISSIFYFCLVPWA